MFVFSNFFKHKKLFFSHQAQQQNFLSFIQPFLGGAAGGGGGGQPAAAAAQPQPPPQMEQPGGFGGIGQFVDMFKNVRAGLGQPAGSREERAQQLANTAQVRKGLNQWNV